ncbi:peptidoglycan DD-metalloendopeptidase family protein [Marinomonas sp. C2222]|uniref:Peptidoglycan DD-metalloendopeptidase family protein n=1 Tax=Marinomonas sargassi TaxID=2984494 RepID=A0ABT2YVA2_9GAMM|nr:peptidoglycan DD-metalloendopeptidase family protein [Marinomonas sargassi]MCV2403700.1 peptidoglycan DD-metalloendopeptidase family protein [Marinomonas sargassi]
MIKLLPAKHLLLIATTCIVFSIVLIALPDDTDTNDQPTILEAKFQEVSDADISFNNLPQTLSIQKITPLRPLEPITQEPSSQLTTNQTLYEAPAPAALVQKSAPPTFSSGSLTVSSGDSLSKLLSNKGISAQDIYKVSQADKEQKTLLQMRPGQTLNFIKNDKTNELTEITLVLNRLDSVTFTRDGSKFNRKEVSRTPDITQTYKEAEINNSLFVDGLAANIEQPLLLELANIFGWDIDFALDIRKGDMLSVLYEEKFLDGEKIGYGNIIAAQFINNGRVYKAIRYETDKSTSYYTPDGQAMRKAFIRTPVDFTRISSKFNPNRVHPVFKTIRPHRGVDYAAPSGTPVKAAGDGKVSFAGKQNGYGNVVIIDHGKGYTTLYAHLRSFSRGIRKGARVKQGKIIAYVGQTGWATGPHLHYEFRINGTHKNPVTVRLPNDAPMPKNDLKNFLPYAKQVIATLNNSHSPVLSQKLASLQK